MLPSGLIATAMLPIAKMPGEKGPTCRACGAEACPLRVTTTLTVPVVPLESTFHGNWALIWPPETNNNGAAMLLKVTLVVPSVVASGMESACARPPARSLP
jgi:hypothetical protein